MNEIAYLRIEIKSMNVKNVRNVMNEIAYLRFKNRNIKWSLYCHTDSTV